MSIIYDAIQYSCIIFKDVSLDFLEIWGVNPSYALH